MNAKNLIVVSLLTISLNVSVQAVEDPKMFFTNGVNNDLTSAKKSAEKISEISWYGKYGVKTLHNSDVSLGSDFWEAVKMSMNWDKFYTKLGTVNTDNYTLNVVENYKNNPRRTAGSDKIIVHLANIYASTKKDGKSTGNFIAQIKVIRSSSVNHSITQYLQSIGLEWSDHPSFQRVKTEDVVVALGEIFTVTPELFNPINQEYNDINNMLDSLSIQSGDKISFIGHSQGNLYQNRIAEQLVASGSIAKDNIRVLSVATPDDYVYNNGKYVTLEEDFVARITFFSDLKANMSNLPTTEYDDVTMGVNKKNGDISGHGLKETYLRDNTKSKKFIIDNFKKNYNDLKTLDDSQVTKQENLWLGSIELEGYGEKVPQGKSIKFDSRAYYSSNVKPEKRKVKVCYALSKTPGWNKSDFVRGIRYSTKTFTTKESSQKISNISYYIPKTIPLGDYYIVENINCNREVEETDYIENQIQYKKISVVAQEKEDIRTTDIRISGTGSGKMVVKNTMVYDGSNPNIGWVYQAYFFQANLNSQRQNKYMLQGLKWAGVKKVENLSN